MTDAQNMSAGSSGNADLSGLLGLLSGDAESAKSAAASSASDRSTNVSAVSASEAAPASGSADPSASSAGDLGSSAPARSQSSPPNQAPISSGGSLLEQLGYASEDVPASPRPSSPAKSEEESAAERKAAEDFLQGLGLGGGSSSSAADDEVGQLQELLVSPTIVALRERISAIEEKVGELETREYDSSELMKNMVAVFAELLKRQLVAVKQEISIELKQVIFAEFKQEIFADFKQDIMDTMAPVMARLADEMDSREKNLSIRVVGISKDAS